MLHWRENRVCSTIYSFINSSNASWVLQCARNHVVTDPGDTEIGKRDGILASWGSRPQWATWRIIHFDWPIPKWWGHSTIWLYLRDHHVTYQTVDEHWHWMPRHSHTNQKGLPGSGGCARSTQHTRNFSSVQYSQPLIAWQHEDANCSLEPDSMDTSTQPCTCQQGGSRNHISRCCGAGEWFATDRPWHSIPSSRKE